MTSPLHHHTSQYSVNRSIRDCAEMGVYRLESRNRSKYPQ